MALHVEAVVHSSECAATYGQLDSQRRVSGLGLWGARALRSRLRRALDKAFQQLAQLLADRAVRGTSQVAAKLYRHIVCTEPGRSLPECLTNEPLRAVAIHRARWR